MNFDLHPSDLNLLYDELYLIKSTTALPKIETEKQPEVPVISIDDFLVDGNVDGNTLVFVDDEGFSKEHAMYDLLEKILAAVKLNSTDYAIFKAGRSAFEFYTNSNDAQTKKALYFSNAPVKHSTFYEVSTQAKFMLSCFPSLDQMSESKEIKGKVWAVLQKMFLS